LGSAEETVLLGCDEMQVDESEYYEGSWYVHLQGSSNPRKTGICALKVTATFWIEISGTPHPSIQSYIPEVLNPQQQCENL